MARPIPQKIKEKLAKILPRLMSPHEGEIVATIRAIERALAAENLDFHDLVAVLTNGAAATSATTRETGTPSHREIPADDLLALIALIRARGRLTTRSHDFLSTLKARALSYDRVYLTEPQLKWLMDLAHRTGVI